MVSIIIPFYNRVDYVKRAVESVINQSYADWEIILVDDCGTEKLDIQHSFGAEYLSKIKLISNEKNLGPGLSRQAGLDVAAGEFVCFLDSDDFYHQDFLLKTLRSLQLDPKASGAFCITTNLRSGDIRGSGQPANRIMPSLFSRKRPWATASWIWRKAEIAEWKHQRTNEDWLFEIDTSLKNNRITHVSEPLCFIDDDTGINTKDLIDTKTPEIHRNTVAVYTVNHLKSFSIYPEYNDIQKAIIKRLVFTSSRLINLKEEGEVWKNGLLIIRYNLPLALLLLLLSATTFNSTSIAGFYKRVLNRIHNVI
jgi:glycosyltransferase involved in cell wall biosynthesis